MIKALRHLFIVATAVILVLKEPSALADDATTNDEVNLSTDQIAKLRGFEAENHYVNTEGGYQINLVRILPVKKTNKRPVIFDHGSTQSSTYFVTNSVNARPKNFADLDAGSMSQNDLEHLLAQEPVAKSLPFLLACFGHENWMINQRGTEFSLGKSGSTPTKSLDKLTSGLEATSSGRQSDSPSLLDSILGGFFNLFKPQLNLASIPNTLDTRYWNFSLDELAKYDLPAILLYVLNHTSCDKVAYVGHSFGNGVMFMLQSEQPQWADKVEPFLAWSPDFYLGHTTSILAPLLLTLQPALAATSTPFPPTPIDPLTRTLLANLCETKLAQETVCLLVEELQFGFSGDQEETLPAFMASQFYSISSHMAAQLAQNAEKGKMHHYDMGVRGNMRAYNQPSAPIYNVSAIRSRSISFWRGLEDNLASPTDVDILKSDLRVRVDDRLITQVPFNHYDLLFGRNVSTLVNIPSLKLIESYK